MKIVNVFFDGKILFDYWKERFSFFLERFLLFLFCYIICFFNIYEVILIVNLELKCGVKGFLLIIKNFGKKIVIIIEGL